MILSVLESNHHFSKLNMSAKYRDTSILAVNQQINFNNNIQKYL